ncbi:hypothetical protein L1987_12165 [Smallanthus sonchifolius]|uniref:Uncharacterized protein n=1 Tax=Smallanthus sonchifolius TaxID=185202 RepID=A0ACB9JFN0_9ASTR|nr:hypothetical protein L1987_12165 [Smallanthus sonchifolius]
MQLSMSRHSSGQDEANEPSSRRGGLLSGPNSWRGLSATNTIRRFECWGDKLVGGFCSRGDDEVRETIFGCRGAGDRRVKGVAGKWLGPPDNGGDNRNYELEIGKNSPWSLFLH